MALNIYTMQVLNETTVMNIIDNVVRVKIKTYRRKGRELFFSRSSTRETREQEMGGVKVKMEASALFKIKIGENKEREKRVITLPQDDAHPLSPSVEHEKLNK